MPLVPSSAAMLAHVTHLFGGDIPLGAFQYGLVELAWNKPGERAVNQGQLYPLNRLAVLVRDASVTNAKGSNVYIGAALRQPGTAPFARAKDADFLALTATYVDLDKPGTVAAAKAKYGELKPTLVVVTGLVPAPRAQLWWKLDSPITDPAQSQLLLKAMAKALDGDPTVSNPSRVMRLAGSVAWPVKEGRIEELTDMLVPPGAKAGYGATALGAQLNAPVTPVEAVSQMWNAAIAQAAGPVRQPDAFGMPTGKVEDGREAYMLATLNACLIQLIGEGGGKVPSAAALFELAWPQFSAGADISKPRANGQPWTTEAFAQKAAYTVERFAAGEIPGCRTTEEALAAYAAKQAVNWQYGPVIPGITGPTPGHAYGHAQPRPATPIAVHAAFPIDAAAIPPRRWSVPGLLLCGSVSILVAPPGSGKSLLTLQMAIAVAAGVSWGGWVPRGRQKVLVINSEDDLDEMKRRLVVAAREMGIAQSQLDGWLDVAENPESIIIAKTDSRTKTVVKTPLSADLVMTIKANGYGLVVVDPFAETFQGDENSNSEVKWAGVAWREVARLCGIALWLVHHTKKYAAGMAGDPDASRGGGAMVGIARVVGTLFTMSEEEADGNEIDEERRFDYVRYDDGKANYSRKDGNAKWFEKVSREVGNATGFLPSDEVGVLLAWKPPDGMDGITVNDLNAALDQIDRGIENEQGVATGQLFSPTAAGASNARWCGHALMELGISEKTAKKLIAKWIKTKVLEVVEYTDPKQRRPRKGVRSNLNNRPGSVS
jgi:hypothetical protein